MKAIDPIEHIRANPRLYLNSEGTDPAELATRLAGDALTLGATRTLVVHHDDWWLVAADFDWIKSPAISIRELFNRVIPFPEAGVNSMRSEVLVSAFADDVVTSNGGSSEVLKGVSAGHESLSVPNDPSWARVVAFRLAPNPQRTTVAKAASA